MEIIENDGISSGGDHEENCLRKKNFLDFQCQKWKQEKAKIGGQFQQACPKML